MWAKWGLLDVRGSRTVFDVTPSVHIQSKPASRLQNILLRLDSGLQFAKGVKVELLLSVTPLVFPPACPSSHYACNALCPFILVKEFLSTCSGSQRHYQ